MKSNFKKYYFVVSMVLGLMFTVLASQAIDVPDTIKYPIAELGGCGSREVCQAYCDQTSNMESCVDFGLKNAMLSENEAVLAKKAIVKIKAGQTPGGCDSKESCQSFCQNSITDLNSCIAFADEIGVPEEEIAQAKKIAQALQKGANLPGECTGKASCESYCQDSSHIDECLAFAEAAQLLPGDEIAEAKKVAVFLKNGKMPGGCKSKSECQVYCEASDHFEECISFAENAQLISKEEAEVAKKTGGQGPGGCKSKATCETYCNLTENAKACSDFAVEKGLVSEEEMDNIKNGVEKNRTGLGEVPDEARNNAENCLNNVFEGNLQKVLAGQQYTTKVQGEKIEGCFEEAISKYTESKMQQGAAQGGQGGQQGPPADIEKEIQSAPAAVQDKIKNEIETRTNEEKAKQAQQKVEEVKNQIQSQVQNMPSGAPPVNIPDVNLNSPPSGGVVPAPGGAPCNSEEECRAMFGGSAPPTN